MKIYPEKLREYFHKKPYGVYFLSGQESFLVYDAAEMLIENAKKIGFIDIKRLQINTENAWEVFYTDLHSPSFFSPKIALCLELSQWKLDDKAKSLLTEAAQLNHPDVFVIIKGPKIERAMTQTQWFTKMIANAAWVDFPQLSFLQTKTWLQQRAMNMGLTLSPNLSELIIQRTENNLAETAAALLKFQRLNVPITTQLIEEVIDVSSEYDVFKLIEACLQQDSKGAYAIFYQLKHSRLEPMLMIGAFARELRILRQLFQAKQRGQSIQAVGKTLKIWDSRLALLQNFMRSHSLEECEQYLTHLAQCDAIVKGILPGQYWHEMLMLCMHMAGIKIC